MLIKNTMRTKLYIVILVLFSTLKLYAQDTKDLNIGVVEEIELDIKIDSAERVYFNQISLPIRTVETVPQQYQVNFVTNPELTTLNPKIKIFTVKPIEPEAVTSNYVKLGYGNYGSPLAEVFVGSAKKKDYSWGAKYKHESSARGSVDKKASGFSNNKLNVFGTFNRKEHIVSSSLSYGFDKYRFYGLAVPKPTDYTYDQNKTQDLEFKLGAKNIATEKKITYDFDFETYSFTSKQELDPLSPKLKESQVYVSVDPSYKLKENQSIHLKSDLYFNKITNAISHSRSFVQILPYYRSESELFNYQIGLNFTYQNDTLNSSKALHVYPDIVLEYLLNKEANMLAYGGIKGEMQQQNFRSHYYRNPWLSSNSYVSNTNMPLSVFAGLRGGVKQKLEYNLYAKYSTYKNMWFDLNTLSDTVTSKFGLIYDKSTAVINLGAEVMYSLKSVYDLSVKLDYFSYGLDKIKSPFHKPSFKTEILNKIYVDKRVSVNANFIAFTGLTALDEKTQKVVKMNGIYDLSLGAEYLINKKASVFLDINNIFSKKYERYYRYKVQGANFMVGFTYTF